MDMEARAHSEHPEALRLWLRLLTCTQLVEKELRGRLRGEFDTTLPRFDLMAQLERAPDGLKMNELSRRMMVTGGNVTGITDQLVAEGLAVEPRRREPADAAADDDDVARGVGDRAGGGGVFHVCNVGRPRARHYSVPPRIG